MDMHYELARTEIATRLHHAERSRLAKRVRAQLWPRLTPRGQRFRSI